MRTCPGCGARQQRGNTRCLSCQQSLAALSQSRIAGGSDDGELESVPTVDSVVRGLHMNRQQSADFANVGQEPDGRSQSSFTSSAASPSTALATITASNAGPLAAHWKTPLRRATVPLLPAPELGTIPPPAEAVAASATDIAPSAAPMAQPSPVGVAAETPARTSSSSASRSDRGSRLRLILIAAIALILIVLAVLFRSLLFHL